MSKSDFHIHTPFCDGKSTPEEIIHEALAKGFEAVGFSGHSYTFFDESYCMSRDGTVLYKNMIRELKSKYRNKLSVFCGVEQDFYSKEPTEGYDYVIGSVHYVLKNGAYLPVDYNKNVLKKAVIDFYDGDIYSLIEDYFETVSAIQNADFIGHFDVISKFNEDGNLFSESNPRYKRAASAAIEKLIKIPFELNTGAMAKGYRTSPYPSDRILKEIKSLDGSIIFSSDCHSRETLGYAFDIAVELALSCGFKTAKVLTKDGFDDVPIRHFL